MRKAGREVLISCNKKASIRIILNLRKIFLPLCYVQLDMLPIKKERKKKFGLFYVHCHGEMIHEIITV